MCGERSAFGNAQYYALSEPHMCLSLLGRGGLGPTGTLLASSLGPSQPVPLPPRRGASHASPPANCGRGESLGDCWAQLAACGHLYDVGRRFRGAPGSVGDMLPWWVRPLVGLTPIVA